MVLSLRENVGDGAFNPFDDGNYGVDRILLDVFVEPASSLVGAVVDSLKANGPHDIAVVPEGPYVIPLYGKN